MITEQLGVGDHIIYRGEAFTYGTDSVLLADFARVRASDTVVDIGAGTGFIAMTIAASTGASTTGIELDPAAAELFARAVETNRLAVRVENIDCRDAAGVLGYGTFSVAVTNPPYFLGGTPPPDPRRAAATHEGAGGVDVMCRSAGQLLKNGGRLYLSYPAAGLVTAFAAMRAAAIEPKRLRLVHNGDKPPYLALIEGMKGGKAGLTIEA